MKKKDEVLVRFNNDIYNVVDFAYVKKVDDTHLMLRPLPKLTMRIFFATVYKVMDEGNKEVRFSIDELNALTGNKCNSKAKFEMVVKQACRELGSLHVINDSEEWRYDNIFQTLKVDGKEIACRLNEDYLYLFNCLFRGNPKGYSKIMLAMLNELNQYEQLLALKLVCYRETEVNNSDEHYWIVRIEDFRSYMHIPQEYTFRDIRRRIIEPCIGRLGKFFVGLRYEDEREWKKVVRLCFYYKSIMDIQDKNPKECAPPNFEKVDGQVPF